MAVRLDSVALMTSALALTGCAGAGAPAAPTPVATPPAMTLCVSNVQVDRTDVLLEGGVRLLTVGTTTADCAWQVEGPVWMTFEPAQGVGPRTVRVRVTPSTQPREAFVGVGTQYALISQRAGGLEISATCSTPEINVYKGLQCFAVVQRAEIPSSSGLRVTADLGQFGAPYRDDWGLVYCGCGAWDMDLRVREPFEPGTYQVRFHVTDAEGRRATTTAPLVVSR